MSISEKLNQFKNFLWSNFNDEYAFKGIVVGAVLGCLATLLTMALAFILKRSEITVTVRSSNSFCKHTKSMTQMIITAQFHYRYCCKCKRRRKADCQVIDEELPNDKEIETLSVTSSYVVIDMANIEVSCIV